MKWNSKLTVFFFTTFAAYRAQAFPCENPVADTVANIKVLSIMDKEKSGNFLGTFEINNISLDDAIILEGVREKEHFLMLFPNVMLQSKTSSGEWQLIPESIAHYSRRRNKMTVPKNGNSRIVAWLPSFINTDTTLTEIRLVIWSARTNGLPLCLASEPLRTVKTGGRVSGYVITR